MFLGSLEPLFGKDDPRTFFQPAGLTFQSNNETTTNVVGGFAPRPGIRIFAMTTLWSYASNQPICEARIASQSEKPRLTIVLRL